MRKFLHQKKYSSSCYYRDSEDSRSERSLKPHTELNSDDDCLYCLQHEQLIGLRLDQFSISLARHEHELRLPHLNLNMQLNKTLSRRGPERSLVLICFVCPSHWAFCLQSQSIFDCVLWPRKKLEEWKVFNSNSKVIQRWKIGFHSKEKTFLSSFVGYLQQILKEMSCFWSQ